MTDKTLDPCGSDSSTELGEPIAYLYHDANTPKDAHPWLHSTMLVLAADRRPGLRGETELFTRVQLNAAVAAERERWADAMRAIMSSPVGVQTRDKLAAGQGTDTDGGRAWLAALQMLDLGPNTNSGTDPVA
jgi:hypothetical protein